MPFFKTSRAVLDRKDSLELVLELLSFSGGENTKGEDQELKSNEARIIENWDAISLGGMQRSKGFNEVADGGIGYTNAPDLLAHHKEGVNTTRLYSIIEGNLVYKDGTGLTLADAAAFTSGILSYAVSAGDKLWITNSTDNLKYKTIGGAITVPSSKPTYARDRIYFHKFRLIAEGGGKTIYGSRAGTGNFTADDAWSLNNDAWSIDLPDYTYGCAPMYPSGNEVLTFTKYAGFSLYGFPSTAYRPLANSCGCIAPYSIAYGNEGVFFVSNYPKLGVFLFNTVDWINLTINHDFVEKINLANRIFGVYRNSKYFLFYNETGSGVSYPNRCKIYDATFGRWMTRPINAALADNFGYPCLLRYDSNELYVASSRKDKLYELETEDDSDEGQNTEANYKTKDFSSGDFKLASGGQFPINLVRMKLLKMAVTYYGFTGSFSIQWTADRGVRSGSQIITISSSGAKLNEDFIVNTSYIIDSASMTDRTVVRSFPNSAVGRFFNFQVLNNATGSRPKIKSIKIYAIALEEA